MGKLETEVEIKSPADKFWEGIKDSASLYPKIFPEIKSIDIVEGEGEIYGSVRLIKYTEGFPNITFVKEKIEFLDDANKSVIFSVIDGEITQVYKTFRGTVQVVPKGSGSSVKWNVEYEKVSPEFPEPDLIRDYAIKTFNGLDDYLLKA